MRWIKGPLWDGFWLLSGLPIGLLLAVMPSRWIVAVIAVATVLETGHFVSPIILSWSHADLRKIVRRDWPKYVLLPPFVISGAVVLPLAWVFWFYSAWNVYHFAMQNFGVSSLYCRSRRQTRKWICLTATVGMSFIPLVTSNPIWLGLGMGVIDFNHWLVDIGLSSRVSKRAWAFIAAALATGIAWLLLRQGPLSVHALPSIIAFRYGVGMVHFIYSARIWRFGDPEIRAVVSGSLRGALTSGAA